MRAVSPTDAEPRSQSDLPLEAPLRYPPTLTRSSSLLHERAPH
jgi:hypothetical protein